VGLGAACMHVDAVFVSAVSGTDSIHRISTGEAGHKMWRCLALGDATGEFFLNFLSTVP
jgi:hypothetical protein